MRINFIPKLRLFLVLGAVFIVLAVAACTPADSVPDELVPPDTQIAEGVAATLTAAPPSQPSATPPPTEPAPTATALPPTATTAPAATPTVRSPRQVPTAVTPVSTTFPDASYVLTDEQFMGEYAVRTWRNENSPADSPGFDTLVTLEQSGTEPIVIEGFMSLDPHNGTDLTGDGVPEFVATTYSGGAHCCFGVTAYSLGDTAQKILQTRPSNCGGEFADLNGDGVLEFVTCDDIFAYTYCPFAGSPSVEAILAYSPDTGQYGPASPRFASYYAEDLAALKTKAETSPPGALGEWDDTNKCGVLPYVLALLYSGQPDEAWSELTRTYTFPDVVAFQQDIEQTAGTSQLFTLP
jgi:hypothetical protein